MTQVAKAWLFFFNDTATTEIYTLSLHDALPIWHPCRPACPSLSPRRAPARPLCAPASRCPETTASGAPRSTDRKSTRLNSSHANISYAVFCLKKKKTTEGIDAQREMRATTRQH